MARFSFLNAGREKRRFPRARVNGALAGAIAALGAQVAWPNGEISDIVDLSYKGFAVRRPGLFPVGSQAQVDLRVQLGQQPAFDVRARMVWANLDSVGLEFAALKSEGYIAMTEFLDAQLLGARLRPVERAFIGLQQSFQHWFQGPSDTHVFVWTEPAEAAIARVSVTLDGVATDFARGQRLAAPSQLQRRALLMLSQMDKDKLPMEEFVRSLGAPAGV